MSTPAVSVMANCPRERRLLVCDQFEVCIRHCGQADLLPEEVDGHGGEIRMRPSSQEDV